MNVLLVDRANYKLAIENLMAIVNKKEIPSRLDLLPIKRMAEYYRPNKAETGYISNLYENITVWGDLYKDSELLSLAQHFVNLALDVIPV